MSCNDDLLYERAKAELGLTRGETDGAISARTRDRMMRDREAVIKARQKRRLTSSTSLT